MRGKNGGIRLAISPKDINIGAVLRHTEANFMLVACFIPTLPADNANSSRQSHTGSIAPTATTTKAFKPNLTAIPINEQQCITHSKQLPIYSACAISPVCQLKPIFFEAIQAFIAVFDRYTLADLISNQSESHTLLK